ncbi:MAG: cytochrome c [Chitinophagales bacterium]|nr:cytochrome c [Chitinophagales bacterium]
MKQVLIPLLKFSPLILLLFIFIYSFVKFGVLDHPGKALYETHCSNCHGREGEGIRQLIPPLKNADYALNHFDSIPCWIINGMNHSIVVNGKVYEQTMYPIKLNEVEIANVMNYISAEMLKSSQRVNSAQVKELLKRCK